MSTNKQPQKQNSDQESVWDYPRPPRVEPVDQPIRVVFNGVTIAETQHAQRVLETSHPPVYYIPPEDIHMEYLTPTARKTYCEFKGAASYWTLKVGERVSENVGWSYAQPQPGYESLKGCIAFYASRVDQCYVGDEQVQPQQSDFYGGWITAKIVGPFKGAPGTEGW